jgi:hypothetical protein
MFGLFKSDPAKKLQKEYEALMEKAVFAQRNGDMAGFAKLSAQAEEIGKKIDEIKANQQGK